MLVIGPRRGRGQGAWRPFHQETHSRRGDVGSLAISSLDQGPGPRRRCRWCQAGTVMCGLFASRGRRGRRCVGSLVLRGVMGRPRLLRGGAAEAVRRSVRARRSARSASSASLARQARSAAASARARAAWLAPGRRPAVDVLADGLLTGRRSVPRWRTAGPRPGRRRPAAASCRAAAAAASQPRSAAARSAAAAAAWCSASATSTLPGGLQLPRPGQWPALAARGLLSGSSGAGFGGGPGAVVAAASAAASHAVAADSAASAAWAAAVAACASARQQAASASAAAAAVRSGSSSATCAAARTVSRDASAGDNWARWPAPPGARPAPAPERHACRAAQRVVVAATALVAAEPPGTCRARPATAARAPAAFTAPSGRPAAVPADAVTLGRHQQGSRLSSS